MCPVDHVTGAVIESCHAYIDREVVEKESVHRSAGMSAPNLRLRLLVGRLHLVTVDGGVSDEVYNRMNVIIRRPAGDYEPGRWT